MEKKWWAIVQVDGYDLLDFVQGDNPEEAIQAFVRRDAVPSEDAKLLLAIPGDKVRDDVEVAGWLLSALEYGPEFAFGPRESSPEEWDDFWKAVKALEERSIRLTDVVGWVRVHSALDLWSPVVG
jgi:hypothetical protein